jgi:hypothetical protein
MDALIGPDSSIDPTSVTFPGLQWESSAPPKPGCAPSASVAPPKCASSSPERFLNLGGIGRPSSAPDVDSHIWKQVTCSKHMVTTLLEQATCENSVRDTDREQPTCENSVRDTDREQATCENSVRDTDREQPTCENSVRDIDREQATCEKCCERFVGAIPVAVCRGLWRIRGAGQARAVSAVWSEGG